MVGPAGTLTLLIVTAAPLGPSDYAWASDDAMDSQATQHQQKVSREDSAFSWATDDAQVQPAGFQSSLARTMFQDVSLPQDEQPRTIPQAMDDEAPPVPLPQDPAYSSDASQPSPGDLPHHADDDEWLDDWQGGCCDGSGCEECTGRRGEFRSWLGGITVDSWISQGFTVNTDFPIDRSNFPVRFNDAANDYQMNQFYVSSERPVDDSGCRWDIGGRVDLLYGTDSIFTTARGLETRRDLSLKWNSLRYGLAMPQLYMEVAAPWADGVTVKLGHFYTILGYETVPAVDNFFYSKPYTFLYGEPFTHTGFLGSARLGDITFHAGMTRGWDNWEDNNNDFSFLGGMNWTSADGRTSIAYAIDIGREQLDPSNNLRSTFSFVVQHKFTERSRYVVQYDRGFEEAGAPDGGDADWFGVNQYLLYTINCEWQAGVRFEWFRDEDAARVRSQIGADYFALTLGLNWMPNDAITFRPEFRWDWVDNAGVRPYVDGSRHDQILLGCDVIIRF